jgi:hypothetical protein
MTRMWLVPSIVALLLAAACLGSSTAHPPMPNATGHSSRAGRASYAVFHIHGTYTTGGSTNHFGGDLRRDRFTIVCRSQGSYEKLFGPLSWNERLCLAILDYRTQIPLLGEECNCPASAVFVEVRGEIRGRPAAERITSCLCGDGQQAASDARVILKTHPPFSAVQ